jgi:Carboxypeptidase regulatory-like domain
MNRKLIATLALLIFSASLAIAAEGDKPNALRVSVVDEAGEAMDGVTVKVYQRVSSGSFRFARPASAALIASTLTDAQGVAAIPITPQMRSRSSCYLVVRKDGRGIQFKSWYGSKTPESLAITMNQAATLKGQVVNDKGEAIAGATVRLGTVRATKTGSSFWPSGLGIDSLPQTTTDEQGNFSLAEMVPGSSVNVDIIAKGYAFARSPYRSPRGKIIGYTIGKDSPKITLAPESIIIGTVVAADTGKPLAGVSLVAVPSYQQPWVPIRAVVTDEKGAFMIGGLSADSYGVQQRIPDDTVRPLRLLETRQRIKVEAGKTESFGELKAYAAGIIELMVASDTDNTPLPKAFAYLRRVQEARRGYYGTTSAYTDSRGISRRVVREGSYRIQSVTCSGYIRALDDKLPIEVRADTVTRKLISLKPSPRIKGIVIDPEGKPVVGASVKAGSYDRSKILTDEKGRFNIPLGHSYYYGRAANAIYLLVRHKERGLIWMKKVERKAAELTITLQPSVTLSGTVVTAEKKPEKEASVTLNLSDGKSYWHYFANATTDDAGRFELAGLPDGIDATIVAVKKKKASPLRVIRYHGGSASRTFDSAEATVAIKADGPRKVELAPIVLPSAIYSIKGVVVSDRGQPLARMYITAYRGQTRVSARTDEQGRFTIDNLTKGSLTVRVYAGREKISQTIDDVTKAGEIKLVVPYSDNLRYYMGRSTPKFAGKTLPSLADLGLKDSEAAAKDKRRLLCLWDKDQNESDMFLRKLAAIVPSLEVKDLYVATVHLKAIEGAALKQWMISRTIRFPAGVANDAGVKALKELGITKTPLLILADKEGVIRADSFPISELEGQITPSRRMR